MKSLLLLFVYLSAQCSAVTDDVFDRKKAKAEFGSYLGSVESAEMLKIEPTIKELNMESIKNPIKTDILGDIVNKALRKDGTKTIENENYEESGEDTMEHFLNSLESDSSSLDENLRRVQNGESLEKVNEDQLLWSSEEAIKIPKAWELKSQGKFSDESLFDDSLISEEDDYYYEYPEENEYWLVPYDSETELDRDALNQAMVLGSANPAKQQSLVIVHETVNVGKIEVNQAPKTVDVPPLADQGLVIIQPDLTQIQTPKKSSESSMEKTSRDVDSSEELKRAEIHAHQKQIQPPRFKSTSPDSKESEAKEARKLAEKNQKEVITEMDHDLEPIFDTQTSDLGPFQYTDHMMVHFSKNLSIVDYCIILLTAILFGYLITLFYQFIRSLCGAKPRHVADNKVAPVIVDQPLPAKEVKIDMKETD